LRVLALALAVLWSAGSGGGTAMVKTIRAASAATVPPSA
jgi:hypothetical protein